jgi:TonB family protein
MYLLRNHPFGVKALHTEMASPTVSRCPTEIAALRLIAEQLESNQALAFLVERMRNLTSATAAAIALVDNGEIVCRASSGNAPSVGARADPESGFSGECVRTGQIVRCEDTETDLRADRLVCRRLDLRSIVIVPVQIQGRPAGILEVFSSRPHAFETSDELALEHIADLVAEITVRQPEPALLAEPQVDEEPPRSMKQSMEMAAEEQVPPSPPIADEAEPTDQPAKIAGKPQPKYEPAAVIAAPPAPAVQSPAATPKEAEAEVEPASSFAAILNKDGSDEPPTGSSAREAALASVAAQRLSPLRMRVTGAGILVTVLVVGGWQSWRAMTPAKIAPMDTQLKQDQRATAPAPNARLLAVNTRAAPAKSNAALAQPKPPKPARAITLPPPDIASSAAPPVIALIAGPAEASPISNLLAAPVAAPKLNTPQVSQTSGGKLIKKVDPIYPPSMSFTNGEVVLKATINRKGQVATVNVVRGQAVLAQAAVAAVRRWRYEPFLLDGVPIEVENDIVVNFKMPGQ